MTIVSPPPTFWLVKTQFQCVLFLQNSFSDILVTAAIEWGCNIVDTGFLYVLFSDCIYGEHTHYNVLEDKHGITLLILGFFL